MVTLRLVAERLLDARPGGSRRAALNLSRQIIARTPAGCDVEAILPKVTPEELAAYESHLPGLAGITQAPLRHDHLAKSWQRGLLTGVIGGGFIHALGLYAPIRDISLAYGIDQTVVTVQHTSAFRRPELHDPADVRWQTAMLRRAHRYASAVVAPTNAVADELTELYDFGDRLRVIGWAADPAIALPDTETEGDEIAERLGLPDEYVLTTASASPRKGLEPLLRAFARPELADARLVVVGPDGDADEAAATDAGAPAAVSAVQQLVAASGVDASRIVTVGNISDAELAVALQRASALVIPSLEAGFGLPMVEAFQFGTPVITSDAPALREVGGGATNIVERGDAADYPARLAEGIAAVLSDTELSRRLRIAGRDRAGVHHWEASADMVWALHADL